MGKLPSSHQIIMSQAKLVQPSIWKKLVLPEMGNGLNHLPRIVAATSSITPFDLLMDMVLSTDLGLEPGMEIDTGGLHKPLLVEEKMFTTRIPTAKSIAASINAT